MVEPPEVPDEDAVWLGILDQAEKAGFTGLLDPGSGQINRNLGFLADRFHGWTKAAEILEIEVQEIGFFGEQGLGLSRIAAEDGDFYLRGNVPTAGQGL